MKIKKLFAYKKIYPSLRTKALFIINTSDENDSALVFDFNLLNGFIMDPEIKGHNEKKERGWSKII